MSAKKVSDLLYSLRRVQSYYSVRADFASSMLLPAMIERADMPIVSLVSPNRRFPQSPRLLETNRTYYFRKKSNRPSDCGALILMCEQRSTSQASQASGPSGYHWRPINHRIAVRSPGYGDEMGFPCVSSILEHSGIYTYSCSRFYASQELLQYMGCVPKFPAVRHRTLVTIFLLAKSTLRSTRCH